MQRITGLRVHERERVVGGCKVRRQADGLLEQVGMQAQAERACGELAYGDVKRLELAMALAGLPSVAA